MALVTMREVLADAKENNYAVGSFNAIDVNMVRGLIAAAEQERSPIIIELGQGQFRFTPPEVLAPVMVQLAKEATVPVVVHLDHGKDINVCVRALKLGFSSVMYDGSANSFEVNVANTKEVIRFAQHYGASVEAEIGKVGNAETGDEDEVSVATEIEADQLTTPEEARAFMYECNVDALAVAFGTAHGKYHGTPKLDFDRLAEISSQNDVPIVMHGGSGLGDEVYKKAIAAGACKINYFTGMSNDVGKACVDKLTSGEDAYYHDAVLTAVEVTKNHAARMMHVFGSAGRVK